MSSQPSNQNPGESLRPILLVEDNPMDVDQTIQSFEEHGVINPIIVCRDGEEALRYMETYNLPGDPKIPLVVLLDLRLPKVDGIEVLRQARQHRGWRRIPFIVTTTSRENQDLETARELGVTDYLLKPIDLASFSELMKRIQLYWELTTRRTF